MTATTDTAHGAPAWVTVLNPIAKRLLRSGVPMGPNALITVRGRTSGEPRSTPLAVIDHAGRRWIWSPWGDVHWVRNLRAAGAATLTVRGNEEEVDRDRARRDGAGRVLSRRPGSGRPRACRSASRSSGSSTG